MTIKWIKLMVDVFNNRKIEQIEAMPEGDSIIVIWIKLLCLAGNVNDAGAIYFTPELPYTEEMLATHFHRPLQLVRLALRLFVQFGMIAIVDDIIHISNWAKYQNVEGMDLVREQTRERVARHRAQKRLVSGAVHDEAPCNVTGNVTVTHGNAIDIDKDIDKDIDIYNSAPKIPKKTKFAPPSVEEVAVYCKERSNRVNPEQFVDFYTSKKWMVGKNKMHDWRASVRTWERNENGKVGNVTGGTRGNDKQASNFDHLTELI